MKKLFLILTLAVSLSSPRMVLAQNLKECLPQQVYINEVNNAPICLSKGQNGTLIFSIPRFKNNELSSHVTISLMSSGLKMVGVSDDKVGIFKTTTFILDGRSFLRWLYNPNTDLVEKHREDISAILNAIEKYNKKPSDLQF